MVFLVLPSVVSEILDAVKLSKGTDLWATNKFRTFHKKNDNLIYPFISLTLIFRLVLDVNLDLSVFEFLHSVERGVSISLVMIVIFLSLMEKQNFFTANPHDK